MWKQTPDLKVSNTKLVPQSMVPQTAASVIAWELVRNADFEAAPQVYQPRAAF